MKNTVLFDLDGTLLPMDFDHFMKLYFHNMGMHFHGWIDPRQLAKDILEATDVMIRVTDGRTNSDKFMEHFATLIDGDIAAYEAHFAKYYEGLFENVRQSTSQNADLLASVQLLIDKGYLLAVATNPLFPYRANLHRLRWAGLNPDQFAYISSFEENRFAKPHTGFYQEVLDAIGKQADECIMVGNDVEDDLPAMKLGIETYLITDHLINRNNKELTADHVGNYQDFRAFVEGLPDLNETT